MTPMVYVGVGTSIGILVGVLVTHAIVKKKYEKILIDEIESVKETYKTEQPRKEKYKDLTSEYLEVGVSKVEFDPETSSKVDPLPVAEYKTPKVNYSDLYVTKVETKELELGSVTVNEKIMVDVDQEVSWEDDPENEEPEEDPGILMGIDVLSFEDFIGCLDMFDRTLLIYNPINRDVYTENDEFIHSDLFANMVGGEAVQRLSTGDYEGDTIYVMNHPRQSLYEIFVEDLEE